MPKNFSNWAAEAGLSASAPRTLANQRIIVTHKVNEYHDALGTWRNVAIAWYAGPNAIHYSQATLNRKQGKYPSINAYAGSVMRRLNC